MITDRTQADVDAAKEILERVKFIYPFPPLPDDEVEVLERGTYTVNSLNRVESKQKELATLLNHYYYMVHITNKTDWKSIDILDDTSEEGDIFTYSEYKRYLNNLDKLKQAFFIYQDTPATPDYLYDYVSANDVEKILVDLESMIEDMKKSFRRCNTFRCGQRRKK